MNLITCTPRETRKYVETCLASGLVPFIQSSPGIGKSSIVRQIAEDNDLVLIDHRLSTSDPTDLSGLPRFINGKSQFCPFDIFPLEGDPIPEEKNGWLLFLDEFNSAPKSVQAAAYKLILDHMVGQYKLHRLCYVVAAGNLSTDKAIVNNLSTAMQSRLIHIEMVTNFDDWLKDVALKYNYDERIIAFLHMDQSKLLDFDPDHQDKTFSCPRTWEFVNRIIKGKKDIDYLDKLIAGTISQGVAIEFVQFSKIYKNLISFEEIIAKPDKVRLPEDLATKWAIITSSVDKTTKDNLDKVKIYLDRFDESFQVLFYRMLLTRNISLKTHPAMMQVTKNLYKFLYD